MSNSSWPHRLQHARPPCPSPTPRACSNSCPLSQWCHPIILSSVIPFSSCLQSFPTSGSFLMNWLLASGLLWELQNCNSCWTAMDRRMLDPTKNRNPTSKGKEKRSTKKTVEGTKSHLELNPKSETLRGLKETLCAPGPRDPTKDWARHTFECFSDPEEAWVSSGL